MSDTDDAQSNTPKMAEALGPELAGWVRRVIDLPEGGFWTQALGAAKRQGRR